MALRLGPESRPMEAREYAAMFVLDVIATVVGIFTYIAIGGSF